MSKVQPIIKSFNGSVMKSLLKLTGQVVLMCYVNGNFLALVTLELIEEIHATFMYSDKWHTQYA